MVNISLLVSILKEILLLVFVLTGTLFFLLLELVFIKLRILCISQISGSLTKNHTLLEI